MTDPVRLQVLRTIDKWDKVGPMGTYDLLTTGKTDSSGAYIEGCGLRPSQAISLVAFLSGAHGGRIMDRMDMIDALDGVQLAGSATTALGELRAMGHANWAHQLDDIVAVCSGRSPPPSADDWDWRDFTRRLALALAMAEKENSE